jgi:Ca-activated chloride channel family protein
MTTTRRPLHRLTATMATVTALAAALVGHPPRAGAADALGEGSGNLDALGPGGASIGRCPLKHTDVAVEISGFVARVTVTQVFENPFPDPVEAVYTFPLSDRAAVDAMTMRTGERTIRGEIKRREEARRIYDAARANGQTAALLDQERPNIFTQHLANLLPGASVDVQIEYVEPLVFHDGTFEFSFPTVVGPRFVPGTATGQSGTGWAPDTHRVPDASRITPPVTPPGTRSGHDIGITVDVDAGIGIGKITSPLHAIDVERPSASRAHVRLRDQAEIPNRDFVLRYVVSGDEVRSGYLAHRTDDSDGYVTFFLLPPKTVTPETAAPKEMIFVIDRSGSQSGLPLEKAKETMLWILDHMNPNDTFQVVDFGNTANVLFAHPEPASPTMKVRARAYVQALEANGGTMMAEAVRTVCAMPADRHRLRVVTFMTDGYIGNDFEVIDLVRSLRGTSRWFLFGTGDSVNRFLLENMARAGGGEVDYVLLNDSGEAVARKFYQHIASPALTDVRLDFQGLDVADVLPSEPSDVWERRPLVIHARYHHPGQGRLLLRGFRQGRPYEQALEVTLPERAQGNAAIAAMWARAKVDELMARDLPALQAGKFPAALEEEIVTTALAHRIMTQFTSFVAVEDRVVNEGGTQRTVTVPVEMPDGVRYEGVFGVAEESGRVAAAPMGGGRAGGLFASLTRSLAMAGKMASSPAPVRPAPEVKSQSLDDTARTRLAPELQALVDGRPSTAHVVDGRVTIKVVLRDTSTRTLRRLEKEGLRIRQVTPGYVLGSVAVEALARIAGFDRVESVTLP